MKTATDGQVFSEYIVTIALILGAMALLGPSLITSVNSYFQALEEGARESQEETATQSPPTGITIAGCTCGPLEKVGCGDDVTCSKQKVVMKANCVPLGCERDMPLSTYFACVDDPAAECCTDPTISNICGDGGCPADELLSSQTCGMNNVIKTECVDDNGNCIYECTGTPYTGPPAATLCADSGGEADNFGLTGDVPVTHVTSGNCTDALKCEYECPPGRIVLNDTCACKMTYTWEKLIPGSGNYKYPSGIPEVERERRTIPKNTRWRVNTAFANEFKAGEFEPPPGGFEKENIEAIRTRVRLWRCGETGQQVQDIPVVNDDNQDHYWMYYVSPGTGKRARCKPHTEYKAGICPDGLRKILNYENVKYDNHSMNAMTVANYDTNDILEDIDIKRCSPDTSGTIDSVDLCFLLQIHYDFCRTWDPANFTCPTDKSNSCKTSNGYTCTPP